MATPMINPNIRITIFPNALAVITEVIAVMLVVDAAGIGGPTVAEGMEVPEVAIEEMAGDNFKVMGMLPWSTNGQYRQLNSPDPRKMNDGQYRQLKHPDPREIKRTAEGFQNLAVPQVYPTSIQLYSRIVVRITVKGFPGMLP